MNTADFCTRLKAWIGRCTHCSKEHEPRVRRALKGIEREMETKIYFKVSLQSVGSRIALNGGAQGASFARATTTSAGLLSMSVFSLKPTFFTLKVPFKKTYSRHAVLNMLY